MPGTVSGASWDFKGNNVLSALNNTKLPFLECQGCWALLLSILYVFVNRSSLAAQEVDAIQKVYK